MAAAPENDLVTVKTVDFLFGLTTLNRIPRQGLPEVVILGRSNVGKSSLINRLCGQKIARTSSTPGCTRQLNFFKIEARRNDRRREFRFVIVDVPGFGYAKLSKVEREELSKLTVGYLTTRPQMAQVLLLNDVRREPQEEELAIQKICSAHDRSCWVILTKGDQLKRSQEQRVVQETAGFFRLDAEDVIVAGEGRSLNALWERLLIVLEEQN